MLLTTLALAVLACILGWTTLSTEAQSLGCNVTAADWTALKAALRERVFFDPLVAQGYCNATNPESGLLKVRYGSCTTPLETALKDRGVDSDCRGTLNGLLYTGEGVLPSVARDSVINRAIEICSTTLARVSGDYFCDPLRTVGCPRAIDVIKFSIFEKCHSGVLTGETPEQQAAYFAADEDKKCMKRENVCVALVDWATCPLLVTTVLNGVDKTGKFSCDLVFPTVPERCALSYRANHLTYCPPLSVFEANMYTILVTCIAGPIVIILLFICYRKMYRAQHISKNEVLEQARGVSPEGGSFRMYHPELAAIVESKYKGVSFNSATGEWSVAGKQEKFKDEQEAARFAYINIVGLTQKSANDGSSQSSYSTARSNMISADFPVAAYNQPETEYVVTAVPQSPEQMKARRLQQLIAFYEYWESSKADIPAHAENLLNRHDFEHVARAVKTKYGVLPPGWAEELEV